MLLLENCQSCEQMWLLLSRIEPHRQPEGNHRSCEEPFKDLAIVRLPQLLQDFLLAGFMQSYINEGFKTCSTTHSPRGPKHRPPKHLVLTLLSCVGYLVTSCNVQATLAQQVLSLQWHRSIAAPRGRNLSYAKTLMQGGSGSRLEHIKSCSKVCE